ncbi:rhodanese-like domain-containing protein [Halorarum salinum]|uniref:Rhodanese-like domain-containing protein n=1 Tax=Halorarum salinum TaxID=2743089 RepID=A0A7D5QD70_9EURY|nr:rhodanese-like domain-containing protein [Halobaculum salinum]QLG64237.1 rhodanese-like domain-containing protein [Halobaculum salinum]
MERRRFLRAAGAAGLAGTVAVSGCLGGSNGNEADGYPPTQEDTPDEQSVDVEGFETVDVEGTAVQLAPIDAAYYWYGRREARFVDARGRSQYDRSRVLGAALSPAPDGGSNDPTADWPADDRIVCYCGCPHHLSSLRAATFIENGYEDVYVIDEGFWEWHERGYPMAGSEVEGQPASYEIRGRVGPAHAGGMAWAWHDESGQREAAPIDADGSYLLELKFSGLTRSSPIRVETPAYEFEAPLADLLSTTVTGPDA